MDRRIETVLLSCACVLPVCTAVFSFLFSFLRGRCTLVETGRLRLSSTLDQQLAPTTPGYVLVDLLSQYGTTRKTSRQQPATAVLFCTRLFDRTSAISSFQLSFIRDCQLQRHVPSDFSNLIRHKAGFAYSLPGMKQLALAMKGVKRQQMVHADVGRLLVALLQLRAQHHHQAGLDVQMRVRAHTVFAKGLSAVHGAMVTCDGMGDHIRCIATFGTTRHP